MEKCPDCGEILYIDIEKSCDSCYYTFCENCIIICECDYAYCGYCCNLGCHFECDMFPVCECCNNTIEVGSSLLCDDCREDIYKIFSTKINIDITNKIIRLYNTKN